jgi:DNA-binding MarR family transcriptional regulator
MTETERGRGSLLPDDARLETWRAFLVAHARLFRRMDDELRAEHDLSLPEYEALLQLAQAPGRRLRMSRLASLVLLSKSGVTRLIDRLENDGSVERSQCSHDGRGAEAVLTTAGLDRLRAASGTHLRGIERYFIEPLDPADLATVERTMTRVAQLAGDTPAVADCERPAIAAATPEAAAVGRA